MKQLALFICFLILHFFGNAQINPAQYTDGLNGYYIGSDTSYQLFDEIKTQQDEDRLLNTYFPFYTTQVNHCYSAISFPDTLSPKPEVDFPYYIPWVNDSNYYRAQQLRFKLNNDTGYAFCYKNTSNLTNPKTAFVIIPGSGINQATAIAIYNPGNYHNNTCAIAQNCLPYGDVYTYVRPNEDFASFWTTTPIGEFKKLNYLAQTSKTNLANKNWAANCYIQIIALTKYLQTKYDKVVVLGLSSGAWGVMFSALQTEPEGALLASGYSISFNDQTYSSNFNQMQYDGMFSSHPIDSVRQTIRAQKTQFLFSYGANDNVTNMADENSNHTTENYFNTPTPPGNTDYFYNFTQHRFPCEVIDTFFTKIKKMPKAYMESLNTCTSDSLILRLRFIGTAPFEGILYRNNTPYQSVYSLNDTFSITLYDEGEFELKNLMDSNQVTGFKTKPFTYNKVTHLSPGNITQQYVCQSDSTLIQLPITGTPPYLVTCLDTNSNTLQVSTYFNNNILFYKKNGNYQITAISDSNNCNWTIPIPFNIANDSLDISFNSPVYWCDSNKHLLNIQTQGRSPWTILYYKSGTLLNDLISDSNHTFIFENGQYLFSQISDFNNCVLSLNQYFNLNASPLQSTLSNPAYSCDSNKTQLDIQTVGNPPYTLFYTENNQAKQVTWTGNSISLFLENGLYYFSYIQDITQCVDSIQTNYSFNSQPIGLVTSSPIYYCDSNKRRIQFNVQGNAPWVMNYSKNGLWLQDTFLQANNTRYYDNGLYQFTSLTDATGCSTNINQSYNFNDQVLSWNLNQQQYDCNTNLYQTQWNFTGNLPISIHYTLNNGPIQSQVFNTYSANWLLPNGQYQFIDIQDQTGCTQTINLPLAVNYNPIAISNTTPIYDCDSNKRRIQFNLQGNAPWVMNYSKNGLWFQDTFVQANNTRYYDNGLYQFASLTDATGCSTNINQSYNFNDQALSWNLIQQQYDCDSNLYHVQFAVQGNAPFDIHYELVGGFSFTKTYNSNLIDLYLPNGQWVIQQISDATGCSKNINLSYNVSFQAISVSSALPVYDCDSNKMRIEYTLQGNAPFTFTLNQLNTNSTQWINSNLFAPKFWLNQGQYTMQEVSDATGCKTNINQYIQHNVQVLNYQILPKTFNCDSNQVKYPIQLQGNAPWIISYRNLNNGILYTKSSQQANTALSLATGTYVIETIADAYCNTNSNDTLLVNFPALQVQVNTPSILCDSGKAAIGVNFQNGLLPAYLTWVYNGTPDSVLLQNGLQTILMPNGTYFVQHIRDSTNCLQAINQTYNADYIPLQWHGLTHTYNCQKDSSDIAIHFNGALQTAMYFTRNNLADTLYLNNNQYQNRWPRGTYRIAYLRDSAQCILPIDTQFVIRDVPVNIQVDTLQALCDSKLHQYTFSLQGRSPWLMTYNNKNISRTISFIDSTNTWICEPGVYDFVSIEDANACKKAFERHDSLPNFIETMPVLSNNYKQLILTPTSYPIQWYYNQQALDTLQYASSTIKILGGGKYLATVRDHAGCIWTSNELDLNFENPISLYPNPASNEIGILVQDVFGDYWQYTISNARGEKIKSGKVYSVLELINVQSWSAGIYFVTIHYQNNPNARVIRMIKQ